MNVDRALRYLLEHEFLHARDLVHGGVSIKEVSYRNSVALIERPDRPGYFIKSPGSESAASHVASEANFYRNTRGGGAASSMAPHVPRFHAYDSDTRMLVLEKTPHPVSGGDLAQIALGNGTPIVESLAGMLATCHALGRLDDAATRREFPHMVPWAFNILAPSPLMFRDMSKLQLEILRLVQQTPHATQQFDEVRRRWEWTSLIHGDIRWENIVGRQGAERTAVTDLRIVDWESVGIGDPAWDIASVFTAYVGYCLLALPLDSANTPHAAADLFACQMPLIRQQLRSFWTAYLCHSTGPPPSVVPELLERTVLYTSARLLQFAFEWAYVRTQMPRFVLSSVQVAMNILADPDGARVTLLGIP